MEQPPSIRAQRNLLGVDLTLTLLTSPAYLYLLHTSNTNDRLEALAALLLFQFLKSLLVLLIVKGSFSDLDQHHSGAQVNQDRREGWRAIPRDLSVAVAILSPITYVVTTLSVLAMPTLISWQSLLTTALFSLALVTPTFLVIYPLLCWTLHSQKGFSEPAAGPQSRERFQKKMVIAVVCLSLSPVLLFVALAHHMSISAQFSDAEHSSRRLGDQFLAGYYKSHSVLDRSRLTQFLKGSAASQLLFISSKGGRLVAISPALEKKRGCVHAISDWLGDEREGRAAVLTHKRQAWVATIAPITSRLQIGCVAFAGPKTATVWAGLLVIALALGAYLAFIAALIRLVVFEPFGKIIDSWKSFLESSAQEPSTTSHSIVDDAFVKELEVLLAESAGRWARQNEIISRFGHLLGISQQGWSKLVAMTYERSGSVGPLIEDIHNTSDQLEEQSASLSGMFKQHTDQWVTQQSILEEVSAAMDDLKASTRNISSSIELVLTGAEKTRETARDSVQKIAQFSKHTDRIDAILEHIQKIARQARMLSLNATIEAMRAGGEASRGFNVIANEMKMLSDGISSSVESVQSLLQDIEKFGEITHKTADQGRELADNTTQSAKEIATVTRQQQIVAIHLGHMIDDITVQASSAQERHQDMGAVSRELNGQAQRLSSLARELKP
jgi:hypothetical protein